MNLSPLRAATLIVLAVGCSSNQHTAPSSNVITIAADDYVFEMPDTIPAGRTTFRLVNRGREPHQAVIMGAPGKALAELATAAVPKGPVPEWWRAFLRLQPTFPGGPGVVVSGDSSIVVVDLVPGNYVVVCYVPSPDGKMHAQKGMFRRLVVTPAPSAATAAAEPKSDLTVTLSDFAFATSAPITAGTHTIRVENSGPQPHELTIERLAPGKTLADWQRWVSGGMRGEPPSIPAGGLAGPDNGKVGWVTVTFTPGNYLFLCYVPDAKDGNPHFVHGMVQQITVN